MGFLSDNDMPSADEINSSVLGILRPAAQQIAPGNVMQQASPGRRKISTMDILGAIVDAGAEFGGSNAGYREGIARQQEQENARVSNEWAQKFNQQKLQAGQNELDAGRFERFGTAARGLSSVMQRAGLPGVKKAFPLLAQQMGMDPDEQEIFAASLEADPQGTLEILNAINAKPENAGSKPKELAVYEMLQKQNPELAGQYLERIASGVEEMSPYQKAQIGLGRDKLTSAERVARIRAATSGRAAAGKPTKAQEASAGRVEAAKSAKTVVSSMREAYGRLRDAGGINARGQGIVGRSQAAVQENVPMVERMMNPEAFSARQDLETLRTQGITSLLPILGSLNLGSKNIDAAKELETWRKAIASASDYESAMRALDRIDQRIEEITAMPEVRPSATNRPRIKLRPKTAPAAKPGKRLRYNPATGDFE